MLFLVFQLEAHRYAIEVSQVAEVLPLVPIEEIARAPVEVAGIFLYGDVAVPVIDLSQMLQGRAAERRLSTRIILVHYPRGTGESRLLGLLAEKATQTLRREPADFVDSGVFNDAAPFLGPVVADSRGLIQRLDISRLLAASDLSLFTPAGHEWPLPTLKRC